MTYVSNLSTFQLRAATNGPKHLGSFLVKIGVSAPIIHAAFTSWKKWCQAAESHNLTSAHPMSRWISYKRNTPNQQRFITRWWYPQRYILLKERTAKESVSTGFCPMDGISAKCPFCQIAFKRSIWSRHLSGKSAMDTEKKKTVPFYLFQRTKSCLKKNFKKASKSGEGSTLMVSPQSLHIEHAKTHRSSSKRCRRFPGEHPWRCR